jgi:hypothetical protein
MEANSTRAWRRVRRSTAMLASKGCGKNSARAARPSDICQGAFGAVRLRRHATGSEYSRAPAQRTYVDRRRPVRDCGIRLCTANACSFSRSEAVLLQIDGRLIVGAWLCRANAWGFPRSGPVFNPLALALALSSTARKGKSSRMFERSEFPAARFPPSSARHRCTASTQCRVPFPWVLRAC